MLANPRSLNAHRIIFAMVAALAAFASQPACGQVRNSVSSPATETEGSVRPFRAQVSDEAVADLRQRLKATRWSDMETVPDQSQGAQLKGLQELVAYWGSDYDWRKGEAKLNTYPQFMTRIDGVDIHFIHVKSKHPNALPLIITHGWPGSVFEQIKLIGPLTDPTAYGGKAEDAFDVVIPSLPGFGFSGRPSDGWSLDRIGSAWDVLMKRLGYSRYVAQGGDWGAGVVEAMGRQAPQGLLGIHTNFPAAIIPQVGAALGGDRAALASMSEKERAAVSDLATYQRNGGSSYLTMMGARPQAVGYGLSDSPAGLAGFMLIHSGFTKWNYGRDANILPTRDDVLDNFSLYWLTNTVTSSARIYWENRMVSLLSAGDQKSAQVAVPVAVTLFPDEVFRAQESWVRKAFPNVIYFNEVDRGGHFAMWEQPELFAQELRAAFKTVR